MQSNIDISIASSQASSKVNDMHKGTKLQSGTLMPVWHIKKPLAITIKEIALLVPVSNNLESHTKEASTLDYISLQSGSSPVHITTKNFLPQRPFVSISPRTGQGSGLVISPIHHMVLPENSRIHYNM